jgi:hypothetical protein
LFVADTLQAIGGAVNAKWVGSGKVEVGSFCDAQGWSLLMVDDGVFHVFLSAGIIQTVGETGVALFNLVNLY